MTLQQIMQLIITMALFGMVIFVFANLALMILFKKTVLDYLKQLRGNLVEAEY